MTRPRPLAFTVPAEAPLGHITLAGLDFGGAGPLLLLCHANGLCAATWGLVAEQLTTDYRVVALDARGHGDSDAPPPEAHLHWRFLIQDLAAAAAAVRDAVGQPIAAAVGASMGGVVANAVAAQSPGLFGRVIMFDPPVMPPANIRRELGMPEETGNSRMGAQARRRRRDWPSRDAARDAWRDKPMFADWSEAAFNLYLNACFRATGDGITLKCAPETEATVFERTADVDTFALAPSVTVPVLLVHAARGQFPRQMYERLIGCYQDGHLTSLEVGHLTLLEDPAGTADCVRGFVPLWE